MIAVGDGGQRHAAEGGERSGPGIGGLSSSPASATSPRRDRQGPGERADQVRELERLPAGAPELVRSRFDARRPRRTTSPIDSAMPAPSTSYQVRNSETNRSRPPAAAIAAPRRADSLRPARSGADRDSTGLAPCELAGALGACFVAARAASCAAALSSVVEPDDAARCVVAVASLARSTARARAARDPTSGSKPLSRSASRAPTVIARAAARPRIRPNLMSVALGVRRCSRG